MDSTPPTPSPLPLQTFAFEHSGRYKYLPVEPLDPTKIYVSQAFYYTGSQRRSLSLAGFSSGTVKATDGESYALCFRDGEGNFVGCLNRSLDPSKNYAFIDLVLKPTEDGRDFEEVTLTYDGVQFQIDGLPVAACDILVLTRLIWEETPSDYDMAFGAKGYNVKSLSDYLTEDEVDKFSSLPSSPEGSSLQVLINEGQRKLTLADRAARERHEQRLLGMEGGLLYPTTHLTLKTLEGSELVIYPSSFGHLIAPESFLNLEEHRQGMHLEEIPTKRLTESVTRTFFAVLITGYLPEVRELIDQGAEETLKAMATMANYFGLDRDYTQALEDLSRLR